MYIREGCTAGGNKREDSIHQSIDRYAPDPIFCSICFPPGFDLYNSMPAGSLAQITPSCASASLVNHSSPEVLPSIMKSNDVPGSSLFAALFQERARHFLARLLSIFLSVVAVTTAFWSRNPGFLAGPFTFLILTYRALAFPPGPNVGTYIEGSRESSLDRLLKWILTYSWVQVINFIAICASLIHCNIGRTLAFIAGRQLGFDSAVSRAVPLMFLVACALAGMNQILPSPTLDG